MFEWLARIPDGNLVDGLEEYIRQFDVRICHSADEPPEITDTRTKLQLLEGSMFLDPKRYEDRTFRLWVASLRMVLKSYDAGSPHMREVMKTAFQRNAHKPSALNTEGESGKDDGR